MIEIQTVEATVGDKATFFCKAKGNPLPEILWYKDDKQITKEDNRCVIKPCTMCGKNLFLKIGVTS